MKGNITRLYIVLILVVIALTGCKKLFGKKPIDSIKEEIDAFRRGSLSVIEKDGTATSWDTYAIERTTKTLAFLERRRALEKPYILYAYFGFWVHKEIGGKIWLGINWIEVGFNSRGARIYCNRDDKTETLDLPFPEYDKEAKEYFTKISAVRQCPYSDIELGDKWSCDVNDYKVTAPEYIFSDDVEIYVTIYDKDGNESEPLELHIQKELKEYIAEQNNIEESQ